MLGNDDKIRVEVEKTLANASIASIRSWLRAKGKKLSANTRERMTDRVAKLIGKGEVTFAELQDAIIGIEEAGGKYILLFDFKENRTLGEVTANLYKLGIAMKPQRTPAKLNPAKPSVEYAVIRGNNVLRVKWSETHKEPSMDFSEFEQHRRFQQAWEAVHIARQQATPIALAPALRASSLVKRAQGDDDGADADLLEAADALRDLGDYRREAEYRASITRTAE